MRRALTVATVAVVAGTVLPVAAASALQPPTAPLGTGTVTYVTDGSWVSNGPNSGTALAQTECPNGAWTTAIPNASWIWAPDQNATQTGGAFCDGKSAPYTAPAETVTFTKDFSVPGNPQGGLLTIAADNTATVTVNGTQVTDFVPGNGAVVNNFHSPSTADITSLLVTGPNEIIISGTNVGNAPPGTTLNPAGILTSVSLTLSLTSTDLCKDGGWQNSSPTFTNQGDCVSYVVSHSPSSS